MKWPWVSRELYDAAVTEANKMHGLAQAAMRLAREDRDRAHHLMDRLIEMKREGFVVSAPMPEPGPEPEPLPREVQQALDGLGLSGSVRYRMAALARRELAAGAKPPEVAARLWQGGEAPLEVEA